MIPPPRSIQTGGGTPEHRSILLHSPFLRILCFLWPCKTARALFHFLFALPFIPDSAFDGHILWPEREENRI